MDKVYLADINGYTDPKLMQEIDNIFDVFEELSTLPKNSKVLLKPNLISKHEPEAAATTHPEVVRCVIRALKKRGITNIIIADSCGGPAGVKMMKSIYKASGLEQVCLDEDIQIYNGTDSFICKNKDGKLIKEFTLMQPVQDVDFIINLPKLKTHAMTGLTAAVKNVFGLIPGLLKAELHLRFPEKEAFGDMLVDLNLALKNTFNIIDGVVAMQGNGPTGGTPYQAGLVVAAGNQYLADLVCCKLIDLPAVKVPYLQMAITRGIIEKDFAPEQVINGLHLIKPLKDFEVPESFVGLDFSSRLGFLSPLLKHIAPRPVVQHSKCIGCQKCAEICPKNVIDMKNNKAYIDKKQCIRCFCCHEMCPVKAIKIKRVKVFDFKL